jgi:hypothetical protein
MNVKVPGSTAPDNDRLHASLVPHQAIEFAAVIDAHAAHSPQAARVPPLQGYIAPDMRIVRSLVDRLLGGVFVAMWGEAEYRHARDKHREQGCQSIPPRTTADSVAASSPVREAACGGWPLTVFYAFAPLLPTATVAPSPAAL